MITVKAYALGSWIAAVALLLMGGITLADSAGTALQSIEPSTIPLGGSAQLTITSIGSEMPSITPPMVPGLDLDGIDWVIAGGESGHHARPCNPDWVRAVRDLCVERGVPFFFKQ